MSRITTIATWFGIVATFAVVFGGLAHAGHADPEGRVESAHGAVHGIVIPPFQGCRPEHICDFVTSYTGLDRQLTLRLA